jgi:hypothetical protein
MVEPLYCCSSLLLWEALAICRSQGWIIERDLAGDPANICAHRRVRVFLPVVWLLCRVLQAERKGSREDSTILERFPLYVFVCDTVFDVGSVQLASPCAFNLCAPRCPSC